MRFSSPATRNGHPRSPTPRPGVVRVACYCRQSVASESEFTSVDAQRESLESYVESKRSAGWRVIPEQYTDLGFSGGTMERPGLARLLEDVGQGRVNWVVCYKLDRLSRDMGDLSSILKTFERHGVGFTSITQPFDRENDTGELLLNILGSVAQFERRNIAARTRDKMHAARKRGMWIGGPPPLGYDVVNKKLVANPQEAERVRAIFELYAERGSLLGVAEELNRRGWTTKSWTTQKGKHIARDPWAKKSVHALLTNPIFIGKVTLHGEVYEGQHDGIVAPELWECVQATLKEHGNGRGERRPSSSTALLGGILRCKQCGASMVRHFATSGRKRFYSYVCRTLQQQGAKSCPGSRAPLADMDAFVAERLRELGKNPAVVRETVKAAHRAREEREPQIREELRELELEKRRLGEQRERVLEAVSTGNGGVSSLTRKLDRIERSLADGEERAQRLRADLTALQNATVDEEDLRVALAEFDGLWAQLDAQERKRMVHLLIEEVRYDAQEETVDIQFRPAGFRLLAGQRRETP